MKKTVKLNRNSMFRRLYRVGETRVTPYYVAYMARNGRRGRRLGITATKKIGNAVQRNRARRVISEAYRLLEDKLPDHVDIVIVARKKTVYVKMQTVLESMEQVLVKGPQAGRGRAKRRPGQEPGPVS